MGPIIETDLKEVLNQINGKLDKLSDNVNDLKVDVARLQEGQKSLNKRLDDTQSSINKRLDNLDFIARTVIGGVVLALIAGLAKILYPNLIS